MHRVLYAGFGALLSVAAVVAPTPSQAQAQACEVRSFSTTVSFGTYDPFSPTPLDVTGTIRYHCSKSQTIQVLLDGGSSASFRPRNMTSGAERLAYNLCFDQACTQVWGDGSAGTPGYVSPPNHATNETLTVYARVFPGQDVAAGSYIDTVTMTVLF